MAFEAIIFTPFLKKKKHTIERIYLASMLILFCASFILILFQISAFFETALKAIAITCVIIGFLVVPLFSFYSYQVLNGKLEGGLIIDEMSVQINEKKISLKEIKSVAISLDDCYENNNAFLFNDTPKISQGVNNYILIKTKDGKEYEVFFRIDRFMNKRELNPFIAQLIKHKVIPFERGIELMKLTTKEDIDELKKTILPN